MLEVLKKQVKSVDLQLAQMLAKDTGNERKIEILQSVKGVGAVTISTLIAELLSTHPGTYRRAFASSQIASGQAMR